MYLLLLLLVPAVLAVLVAFILNPIHVSLNLVQILAFCAAVFFGFVAYFQGLFESISTLYFFSAVAIWLLLLVARRPQAGPIY